MGSHPDPTSSLLNSHHPSPYYSLILRVLQMPCYFPCLSGWLRVGENSWLPPSDPNGYHCCYHPLTPKAASCQVLHRSCSTCKTYRWHHPTLLHPAEILSWRRVCVGGSPVERGGGDILLEIACSPPLLRPPHPPSQRWVPTEAWASLSRSLQRAHPGPLSFQRWSRSQHCCCGIFASGPASFGEWASARDSQNTATRDEAQQMQDIKSSKGSDTPREQETFLRGPRFTQGLQIFKFN